MTMAAQPYTPLYSSDVQWMVREDAPPFLRDDLIPRVSAPAFFQQAVPLKKGDAKSLWQFSLPVQQEERFFIIKRYEYRHLADRLKTLVRPCKAQQELEAARGVDRRGIPTPLPLAIGVRRRWRIVRESFVILEKIKDCQDLNRYFLTGYAPCASGVRLSEKWKIIRALGELARRVNEAGVHQSDFSLNNFLIARDSRGDIKLYLSDFEKITLRRCLSFNQEVTCLAKLNRVGREVSLADRMRFLKSYAGMETGSPRLRALSHTVQQRTRMLLIKDYGRGRTTNVYTDALYHKYDANGINGQIRKGYDHHDIIAVVNRFDLLARNLPHQEMKEREEITVDVSCAGRIHRLNAVRYLSSTGTMCARDLWTKITTLALAGFPVTLPHAFLEVRTKHEAEGYLFYHPREDDVPLGPFCVPSRGKGHIVAVLEMLVALLLKLHRFGAFSDAMTEATFTVVENRSRKPSLYFRNPESFIIKEDVTLGEKRRNLILLNAMVKKYHPSLEYDITQRYFRVPTRIKR